ncbi:MAG: hypothetical protein JWM68_223 [Verrucomicrobiales bacterium]|nr:hypothetical protein [Verrucomicrobiales bacterium]
MRTIFLARCLTLIALFASAIVTTLSAAPVKLQFQQQGTNFLLAWPSNYSAFSLEFSTNLNGNWTAVPTAPSQTNPYVVLDPSQTGPRYYRLVSPCGTNAAPYLPAGTFITWNSAPITFPDVTNVLLGSTFSIDASAFIDPSSCFGNGGLSYAWQITTNGSPILTNVSSLTSPVLVLKTTNLLAGVYGLNLAVTGSSGLTTNVALTMTLKDARPGDPSNPGTTPFVPEGSYLFINNIPLIDNDTAILGAFYPHVTWDPMFPFSTQIDPFSFIDASAFIDPATHDNSTLTYLWRVNHATLGPSLEPWGVAGFDTSRLKVLFQGLANGGYDVHLFVTGLTGTSETVFEFQVLDSEPHFRTPCNTNTVPYLEPGSFVTLNGSPVPALFQLATNVTSVIMNASAFTSRFQCGGYATLTYHWALAPTSPNAFTGNISGTNTSVLTVPASSLATGSYIFRLTVTDTFDGSMTQKDFPVRFLRTCDLHPDPATDPGNLGTYPFLPAGSYLFANGIPLIDGDTAVLVDYYPHLTYDLPFLFSTRVNPYSSLDVGAVIDPATCDNTTLTYQWIINHNTLGQNLHPWGVTGYNTSRLKIHDQTLANGFYDVHALVTGLTGSDEFVVEFEVRDSNAQFRTPCGTNLAPYLPAGSFVTLNGSPVPATFHLATNVTSVVFDSSAFSGPSGDCSGPSTYYLNYRWELAPSSANLFTGSVIGADAAVLTVPASSLATGSYIFRLTVTDTFDGSMTQKDFPVQFLRP